MVRVNDEWEEFRDDDGEPIDLAQLATLNLSRLPDDVELSILDDYFPETRITRAGDLLVDVPVREERVDRMRAFGPHVILVLRRERAETTLASWVIAAEREDGFTWP